MLNASMAIAWYLTVLGDVGCRSFIESPLRSQNFGNRDGVLRLDELMARWLHGLGVIWLTLPTSCVEHRKGRSVREVSTLKLKTPTASFLPEVFKGLPSDFL